MSAPEASARAPLLAVRELGVDFLVGAEPRTAVDDLSLDLHRGQILALVGESGSGKSVTALSLLGLLGREARVRGRAVLAGDEPPVELLRADAPTLRSVRGRRIGAVFQDPFASFNPVLRIGPQIVEALDAHEQTRRADPVDHVHALLRRVGLDDPQRMFRAFPHELSGGQLQRAMIAMAISGEPDLLIADEPTTALDVTVQSGILELLHGLREDLGTAILLITHDMGVVADLADDVIVMRAARVVEHGDADDVFFSPRDPYTRELLAAVPRVDGPVPVAAQPPLDTEPPTPPAVELRDVRITYGPARRPFVAVDGVSLTVAPGQTVGLVGESGSGKTTIGKAIARLVPTAEGTITLAGHDLAALGRRDLRAARAALGFVFQNPSDSLDPRARVAAVIGEPLELHTALGRHERRARARELLERVHLPADVIDRFPHQLSGGQRQRVAIARALVLRPRLVIADEPTSALDVAVQATILTLLAELQRELNFGCLFISHDLAVVRQVAQRVVVMHAGRVVESGHADDVLSRPRGPYTQALLRSVPAPDPRVQRAKRAASAAGRPDVATEPASGSADRAAT